MVKYVLLGAHFIDSQYPLGCVNRVPSSFEMSCLSLDFALSRHRHHVTVQDSKDAERLMTSVVKHKMASSNASKLNSNWIKAGLCPAHKHAPKDFVI